MNEFIWGTNEFIWGTNEFIWGTQKIPPIIILEDRIR